MDTTKKIVFLLYFCYLVGAACLWLCAWCVYAALTMPLDVTFWICAAVNAIDTAVCFWYVRVLRRLA